MVDYVNHARMAAQFARWLPQRGTFVDLNFCRGSPAPAMMSDVVLVNDEDGLISEMMSELRAGKFRKFSRGRETLNWLAESFPMDPDPRLHMVMAESGDLDWIQPAERRQALKAITAVGRLQVENRGVVELINDMVGREAADATVLLRVPYVDKGTDHAIAAIKNSGFRAAVTNVNPGDGWRRADNVGEESLYLNFPESESAL